MRDASGMIGRTEAGKKTHRVLPCVSEIQSECTGKERELGRSIPWRSIRSKTAHSNDLCRDTGAFGGTGELHVASVPMCGTEGSWYLLPTLPLL